MRRPVAPPASRLPGWGYLEWFVVLQLLSPGLLFVPGLSPIRTVVRTSAYLLAPAMMLLIVSRGVRRPGVDSFPPRVALMGCMVWLCASILNPETNSLAAGLAHCALYFSVMSPAFWAGHALKASGQLSRVLALIFLCNGLSAALGVAQTYRPDTFNPPVYAVSESTDIEGALSYRTDSGETITRPAGLTDSPGAATVAGMWSVVLGVSFALRPTRRIWRLGALGLAFIGVAVIFYSQVRSTLILAAGCVLAMPVLYLMQGQTRRATMILTLGGFVFVGSFVYVVARVGSAVSDRFATLVSDDPVNLYNKNRGGFVAHALGESIWEYPLGAGLGRWGQINQVFGDKSRPGLWAELQWSAWVYDGGFPLVLLYNVAIGLAMLDSIRITLRSRDKEVQFWGVTVVSANLSILGATFGNCPFLMASGVQFWLLSALLHAADVRARDERDQQRRRLLMAARMAQALQEQQQPQPQPASQAPAPYGLPGPAR